ncbi:MAG: SAM-dependent methyltransferase [Microbacterium sp.]|uniref:SAM-dependent methyltransferase n=1 Tax=Microbacterium sp. TaxID=51671 RepID=UPI0039E62E65
MTWMPVYFADGRLGAAELCAAVLDGHLVRLGEGYVAADTVETMTLRAASLRPLTGTDAAATHTSAAWVLGARDRPPEHHSLQRVVPHRTRHRQDVRYLYRDPLIPAEDLLVLAGVAVTTPARTVADLLRDDEPDALSLVAGIRTAHPGALTDARAWFGRRPPMPGKRRALALLERYDEVTR